MTPVPPVALPVGATQVRTTWPLNAAPVGAAIADAVVTGVAGPATVEKSPVPTPLIAATLK